MKRKLMSFAALLCLSVLLISCGLPDPQPPLQAELDMISSGEGDYINEVLNSMFSGDDVLAQYPSLQGDFEDLTRTMLQSYSFNIVDKTIDNKEKTAVFEIDVTALSSLTLEAALEDRFADYISEVILSGVEPDEETMMKDMIAMIKDIYTDATLEKETVRVQLNMTYDSDSKKWTVDNAEDLFAV